MKDHKFYQLAYDAHRGTSFSPDRRAEQSCKEYDTYVAEMREKVTQAGGDADAFESGYEKRWLAWMRAKGRCMSAMITGPSGFPVRQQRKAHDAEHKRCGELIEYAGTYLDRLKRRVRRAERADVSPLDEARQKLSKMEEQHALMLAANKAIKSKGSDAEKSEKLQALGFTPEQAAELLQHNYWGYGFASFTIANSSANIRRQRDRVAELEKRSGRTTVEAERTDGVRIVENAEADRLQLFFPGKPDAATIGRLKASGFRWSPSNGCWQRQLTEAARQSANRVLATEFFCEKV